MKKPEQTGCALCLLDGVWSKPVKGWDGFPICRKHVSETLATSAGLPAIAPTIDLSRQSQSLH
jgi:hypothetical protein